MQSLHPAGSCTSNGVTCYTWDDTGNLTQKRETAGGFTQITQYRYDTQNRLVEVLDASSGPSKLVARYGYDPLDRRIWKEQYRDKAGALLAQAKRTYYLYADEGLIAEATQDITLGAGDVVTASSASTGTPAITTQYGPTPDSEFGTDVLFIKTKNSNNQDVFAYYHRDQLGTPVQATDKAGNIVWAASYNVFGLASITTPAATASVATITSNIRLPGQYLDEETGLHYNYRRYYDPQIGRYVTSDPIGLLGGINRYVYGDVDPANVSDPWGLMGGGGNHHNSRPFSAADLPTLPDWAVNGAAGWGDMLSFGITARIRSALDIGPVDQCSAAYKVGEAIGVVNGLALGWTGGLNGGAKSVFWSGPGNKQRAAQLGISLEKTPIGAVMDYLGSKTPYWMWKSASATFAANAKGTATKVGTQLGNIWRTVEQPILNSRNVPIVYLP